MANKFEYEIKSGKMKGYFNIYQSRSGHIVLQMGDGVAKLTSEQISSLNIDVYNLIDFDVDDFNMAYSK